jgi:CubicO group peptidase (beta-lactamase class C family)
MRNYFLWVMLFFNYPAMAQTGIAVASMTAADNLVKSFLATYDIPGATVAMSKDGKIIYSRAFGFADIAKTVATQPYHLFRIASVSKPVTAIAIMKLMQEGRLSLTQKVFGSSGILKNHPIISTATITDTRIYDITVQQLLEHSAGWDRSVNCNPNPTTPYPYFFSGCDPIAFPLRVTQLTGTTNPVKKEAHVKFLLEKGLDFTPGTKSAYSNIGYTALGIVIEQLTGVSYEQYVRDSILAPVGAFDMHNGKNLLSEKQEREVEYIGNGYTNLSCYGTGQYVPWEYGGFSVEAMDAHGGWIATASDLLRLITAVDGFATKPDILNASAITTMITPSATDQYYAKGWQVNPYNNWWHTGGLDGTASEIVRASNGYCWAIILNKRNITNNNFYAALDNLGWNMIAATSTWPTHDLMLAPTVNASNLTVGNVTLTSATLSWTNGNGSSRMLLIRPDSVAQAFPLDGTDYAASAVYGSGASLGASNFIIFNGTGNSVNLTGLTPGVDYTVRVVEYNKSSATGNNALYVLGNNPVLKFTTVQLFTFTGNGLWSNSANWQNGAVPPATLPRGSQVIINPASGGECVLDVQQTISKGASLTVSSAKKLRVNGNLTIK